MTEPLLYKAAIFNIGDNPLIGLIVVLLLCGFAALVWHKVILPLLGKIIGQPWLGIVNWIVIAILVIIALNKALEVFFGITLFNM